jgi:hypothetical protein
LSPAGGYVTHGHWQADLAHPVKRYLEMAVTRGDVTRIEDAPGRCRYYVK